MRRRQLLQVVSLCLCFGCGVAFGRSHLVLWVLAFGAWVAFRMWSFVEAVQRGAVVIPALDGGGVMEGAPVRFPLPAPIACPVCTYTVELSGAWSLSGAGLHSEEWRAACKHCGAALVLSVQGRNLRPGITDGH